MATLQIRSLAAAGYSIKARKKLEVGHGSGTDPMNEKRRTSKLSLNPNARLRMTVQKEMGLDPNEEVFNDELLSKYLAMHREALTKQEALGKSVVVIDIALAAVIFGKNLTIPIVGISLSDLPAALQTLSLLSSFAFLMLSLGFLNALLYQAIIDQFHNRRAEKYAIDPDFLIAASSYVELWMKAFRGQMNIWGKDFYPAGLGYRVFYGVVFFFALIAVIATIVLHLALVGFAVWMSNEDAWWFYCFAAAVVSFNAAGIGANLMVGFTVHVWDPREESKPTPPHAP